MGETGVAILRSHLYDYCVFCIKHLCFTVAALLGLSNTCVFLVDAILRLSNKCVLRWTLLDQSRHKSKTNDFCMHKSTFDKRYGFLDEILTFVLLR